jgi:hypothetical protein
MKYLLIFLLPLVASAYNLDQFIYALESVESNHNSEAIGDGGKAFGILQIHAIYVRDYNRITGENLKHLDCFDPEISRKITKKILIHYSKSLDIVNAKHLAFIHNGGGSAWKRVDNPLDDKKQINLEKYFDKVLTALKK